MANRCSSRAHLPLLLLFSLAIILPSPSLSLSPLPRGADSSQLKASQLPLRSEIGSSLGGGTTALPGATAGLLGAHHRLPRRMLQDQQQGATGVAAEGEGGEPTKDPETTAVADTTADAGAGAGSDETEEAGAAAVVTAGAEAGEGVAALVAAVEGRQEQSDNSGVAEEIAMVVQGVTASEAQAEPVSTPHTVVAVQKNSDDGAQVSMSAVEQLELEKKAHEDDEQYASFMTGIMGIGTRFSPTLLGVTDKTKKLILPRLVSLAKSTRVAFAHTSTHLQSHIEPYVGSQFSPLLATLLFYTLLLLPLLLILYLFSQVRVVLSVRKLLLLCNLYLALYCAGLFLASIIISGEPMASLHHLAEANFYILQILQACGYVLYLFLQAVHLMLVVQEKDVRFPLLKATLQMTASTLVGLHYYVTVFEPAMLDQSPQTAAGAYAFYSLVFVALAFLSRATIKNAHKQG